MDQLAGRHHAVDGVEETDELLMSVALQAAAVRLRTNRRAAPPEMHQTKKGNQWHFGMKAHIGVDIASGVMHSLVGTAANEADIPQTAALPHGQETDVFADAGYMGADKRPRTGGPGRVVEHCDQAQHHQDITERPAGIWQNQSSARCRRCGPGLSTRFTSSRTSSGIRSCAITASSRTPRNCATLFALANLVIIKKALLAEGPV
jgi:transposase, IS5 family